MWVLQGCHPNEMQYSVRVCRDGDDAAMPPFSCYAPGINGT
jgi:hypothetical protein